jgi:hypothetical protein
MDVAGLNAIKNLIKECHTKKTVIIFSGLQQQAAEMFEKAAIRDNQVDLWLSPSYDDAIILVHQLVGQVKPETESSL